jgi:hypothetical protein
VGISGVQNEWSTNLWANGQRQQMCGTAKGNKERGDAFFMGGE